MLKDRRRITVIIGLIVLRVTSPCYVFPAEQEDPCKEKRCPFGARCIPSADGKTAECRCPENCPSLGDHVGSRPVCGSDGLDYRDLCELRRTACLANAEIAVKYHGKCGKCGSSAAGCEPSLPPGGEGTAATLIPYFTVVGSDFLFPRQKRALSPEITSEVE